MKQNERALQKAIQVVGGITETADKLGITKQAVSSWRQCPPQRALDLEKISGVSRHELRPDIYGPAV